MSAVFDFAASERLLSLAALAAMLALPCLLFGRRPRHDLQDGRRDLGLREATRRQRLLGWAVILLFFGGGGVAPLMAPPEFSPAAELMAERIAALVAAPLGLAWEPLTHASFTPGKVETAADIDGEDAVIMRWRENNE